MLTVLQNIDKLIPNKKQFESGWTTAARNMAGYNYVSLLPRYSKYNRRKCYTHVIEIKGTL